MPSGKLYHWEFEKRGGEQMALDVPGRLTLDNDSLMVEAALEGVGLAFVSDFWVTGHLAAGTLRAVLDAWTPPFPGLRLYYPRHRHMTAGLRAFVDMIREETKLAARASERAATIAKGVTSEIADIFSSVDYSFGTTSTLALSTAEAGEPFISS